MAFCSHLYLSAFLERFIGENILLIPNFGTLLVDCEELESFIKKPETRPEYVFEPPPTLEETLFKQISFSEQK